MQLEVGPFFRDYSQSDAYKAATKKFAGTARIGPDGSLENYTSGQPFPMDSIDCLGDRVQVVGRTAIFGFTILPVLV